MIVKEDFLNKLRQFFSLNLYEAKIWTALLSRGVSTAGELSDIGNVPRSRAYDILESLEKKGFVVAIRSTTSSGTSRSLSARYALRFSIAGINPSI